MGLDHGFNTVLKTHEGEEVHGEIAVFRKHPNLHGWIEKEWRNQVQPDETEDFNCVHFYLDLDTINRLQAANENDALPPTTGFFFGSDADDLYRDELNNACLDMKQALKDGYEVYYWSWW